MSYQIEGATHRFVEVNGITLSVHEAGEGPAVVFSHGFPELAYSWRHQLPAVADSGFRAVAPDQRGYGATDRPSAVTDFDIFHLTDDLAGMLDALDIDRAVLVGHDWGGFVVWQMALLHPDRVMGVVGVNTPYVPRFPVKPTELFKMMGGENHYIVWFQTPAVPDRALAENVEALFRRMMRTSVPPEQLIEAAGGSADFVEAIVNGPDLGTELLSEDELVVYVETFRNTGFTGALNWYRNFDHNWAETPDLDGATIDVPCLMVTAEWDPVLTPAMAEIMPSFVPDLETHMIERCGHWTQQEHPEALNRLLTDWLTRRFGDTG